MEPIFIILHVLACVALILTVLLQKGKGAGMGAVFGGSSQTIFGSAGATTFLQKATTGVAILFMLTSLGLSLFYGKGGPSSVMEDIKTEAPAAESAAPASPAAPAAPEAPPAESR